MCGHARRRQVGVSIPSQGREAAVLTPDEAVPAADLTAPQNLNSIRRRIFSCVGVPLSVRGVNVQRSTARNAALLNMRAGLALTTVALATLPSGMTVNSTSTQPS